MAMIGHIFKSLLSKKVPKGSKKANGKCKSEIPYSESTVTILNADDDEKLEELGWKLLWFLAKGSVCIVRVAESLEDGKKYACKIYNKDEVSSSFFEKHLPHELEILRSISHPGITKVVDIVDLNNRIYIFMERANGGDLHNYFGKKQRLSSDQTRVWFSQLAQTVKYLHDNNIVHRDIKLENILISGKNLQLTDFGFARRLNNCDLPDEYLRITVCGTPGYCAPEVMDSSIKYDPKCADIFSLGVVLYFMIAGRMAVSVEGKSESAMNNIMSQMRNMDYYFPPKTAELQGKSCIETVLKMLSFQPSDRPTIDEIIGSEWLKGGEKYE